MIPHSLVIAWNIISIELSYRFTSNLIAAHNARKQVTLYLFSQKFHFQLDKLQHTEEGFVVTISSNIRMYLDEFQDVEKVRKVSVEVNYSLN